MPERLYLPSNPLRSGRHCIRTIAGATRRKNCSSVSRRKRILDEHAVASKIDDVEDILADINTVYGRRTRHIACGIAIPMGSTASCD